MWSIGGALLVWAAICAGGVLLAMRKVRAQLEPARTSFTRLHDDVTAAVDRAARDTGRAAASRQVLLRHGRSPEPR